MAHDIPAHEREEQEQTEAADCKALEHGEVVVGYRFAEGACAVGRDQIGVEETHEVDAVAFIDGGGVVRDGDLIGEDEGVDEQEDEDEPQQAEVVEQEPRFAQPDSCHQDLDDGDEEACEANQQGYPCRDEKEDEDPCIIVFLCHKAATLKTHVKPTNQGFEGRGGGSEY